MKLLLYVGTAISNGCVMYTIYIHHSISIRVVCAEVVQLSRAANTKAGIGKNVCDNFVEVIDDWQAKTAFLLVINLLFSGNDNYR